MSALHNVLQSVETFINSNHSTIDLAIVRKLEKDNEGYSLRKYSVSKKKAESIRPTKVAILMIKRQTEKDTKLYFKASKSTKSLNYETIKIVMGTIQHLIYIRIHHQNFYPELPIHQDNFEKKDLSIVDAMITEFSKHENNEVTNKITKEELC